MALSSTRAICDWCTNRAKRLIPKYYRESYVEDSRDFANTQLGAEKGCQICAVLCAGLIAAVGLQDSQECKILTTLVPSVDKQAFTLEFRYSRESQKRENNDVLSRATPLPLQLSRRFEFCSPGNRHFLKGSALVTVDGGFQPAPLKALQFLPELVTDTRGDGCISIVNEWISSCELAHPACKRQDSRTSLPRRVIDVGSDHLDESPRLHICNEGEFGQYIALSHCWGSTQHFITETTNIEDRRKGIRWQSLPKTFQDAITVTRKLGIRFIWIDSLCIIQDDSADWEMELSNMSDIYKNSFLTLAAVSADNDQAGFLGPRPESVLIKIPLPQDTLLHLKVRHTLDRQHVAPVQEPLNTRAWAFQERLVPQRILSFGSKQMRWECNSSTWTESGSAFETRLAGHASSRELYHSTLRFDDQFNGRGEGVQKANYESVYSWWRTAIVPAYARLGLTKEEDRLPALSAIAKEVQRKTSDVYLAGLWKNDIIRGLFWSSRDFVKSKPAPGRVPATYRAPSWSWASIETKSLAYEFGIIVDDWSGVDIIEAHCLVDGFNLTGKVKNGHIKMSCRWHPAIMNIESISEKGPDYGVNYSFDGLPVCYNTDATFFCPDVALIDSGHLPNSDNDPQKTIHRSDLAPGLSHPPPYSGAVSCILLGRSSSGHVFFLVLGSSRIQTGAFERLGLAKIRHGLLRTGWYDAFRFGDFTIV